MQTQQQQRCAISFCSKPPSYRCSKCQTALYCTKGHQKLHWASGHKIQCLTPEEKKKHDAKIEKQKKQCMIENKRKIFRKNFVDSYSTNKIEDYIPVSRILEEAEEENGRITKFSNMEDIFNHGFTVCISIKSFYIAGHIESAKNKINTYVKNNKEFLAEVQSYARSKPMATVPLEEKIVHLEKKLELISILANLSYAVGISHHFLYSLYASHLEHIRKQHEKQYSNEVSNMYFLLGCDYAEQGFPIKSIACFNLCAEIRGQESESCFFNIAVLFFWMGKTNQSIVYFNKTLHRRELYYGESSSQVAEIYKNLGAVYLSKFDFHTSDYYYSRAISMVVNSKGEDRTNPSYQKLQQSIQNLFRKLCSYLKSQPSQAQKPQLYIALKQGMLSNKKYPMSLIKIFRQISLQVDSQPMNVYWAQQFIDRKNIITFKPDFQKFLKLDMQQFNKIYNPEEGSEDETNQVERFRRKKKGKATASKPKEEFTFKMSDKLMSLLSSEQLIWAIDAQEKLSYVMTLEKAIKEIERSAFVESLEEEQYVVFRKDNKDLYAKAGEEEGSLPIRKASIISKQEEIKNETILKAHMNANKEEKKQKKIVKFLINQ